MYTTTMTRDEQARADATHFLKENITAVVATSRHGEPRASTVYYYMDDYFNFYFITKQNSGKYASIQLEMNAKAAIVVGTGPEYITVQAHGTAELVADDAERDRILGTFAAIRNRSHITAPPIDMMENLKDGEKIVFKLVPDQILFMNMNSTKYPSSRSDDFVEIFSIS